ncbi:PTS mannose transporter subunit IID [Bombilactobacillus bombi]|uniref:PTS mannose transporter subunit IID n=1 Tax=Bombilactobacillus bombi TaxID=1303590 RepID=A0A3R6YJX6_9LACO|nr:PTS system mannose/fructose/sorbose family transporter subunit IID [Bombilactobacillus bombi]RHW47864.1 PTS mannose transporter subunit IID [Bombilactobacillus bombi]
MSKDNGKQQDQKVISKMFKRSCFLFSSFNMVKMQGYGYEYAMLPAIDEFYKDDPEGKRAAIERHSSFFNCTYETAPFIMGLNAAMEKENSQNPDFDPDSINAIKAALMGPLSGIGDSIFWGTLRLIAAGIGIPLAMKGNILGPILFLIIYHIPSIFTRYKLLQIGYTSGEKFISSAFNSGLFELITNCATIVGLIMVGAMTASSVTIKTALKWNMAGTTLKLQSILNSIMPGLLPLLLTLAILVLLRKKVKVIYLLFGVIILGIIGAFLGIF